jgi:hypothetical protein
MRTGACALSATLLRHHRADQLSVDRFEAGDDASASPDFYVMAVERLLGLTVDFPIIHAEEYP